MSGKVKTMKMAEDGREFDRNLPSRRFFRHQHYSSNNAHEDTANSTRRQLFVFFPKHNLMKCCDCIQMLQESLEILSHEIRKKDGYLLQLAYQSVRKRQRFYVYTNNTKMELRR
jgi:hypothetical protein